MFDIVMRMVSTLLGLLIAAIGGIWILQGFNIAFLQSFMAGDPKWVFFGMILAAVGVCQVIWSNRRQRS